MLSLSREIRRNLCVNKELIGILIVWNRPFLGMAVIEDKRFESHDQPSEVERSG